LFVIPIKITASLFGVVAEREARDINKVSKATTSAARRAKYPRYRFMPNDQRSATRRAGRNDCNHDAPAGLAAAHVCA
jgi:DNA invertase Pin-like site-specific DNA recombinase